MTKIVFFETSKKERKLIIPERFVEGEFLSAKVYFSKIFLTQR